MKVVITEKFSQTAQINLQKNNSIELVKLLNISELDQHIATTEVLIIRSKTQISESLLASAQKLKLIITCTSGFDHIDLLATQKKNITVMYTPDANSQSAAELTWGLVLSAARNINESHKQIKAGLWNQSSRENLTGTELSGKTYGVVGLGRIGQKVAGIAKAFDMNVVVFDPYQDDDVFKQFNLKRSSYEEVLKQSDVMSFHVPATAETKNMLNRSHFEYINRNLILVNTSRGSVVHEDDLCLALENKWLAAAGLDVFNKEPLSRESKLLQYPNVILTQHMGALTHEAFEKASHEASELCLNFINKKLTKNTLPLVNEWGSLSFKD